MRRPNGRNDVLSSQCPAGMLTCMTATQLAIRFTGRQIETLDALAADAHTTRSSVVKQLVDEADRARVAARYAAGYPVKARDIDEFGDVDGFHREAESERVKSRVGKKSW